MNILVHSILLFALFCQLQAQSYPTQLTVNYPTSTSFTDIRYSSSTVFLATSSSLYVYYIPTETYTQTISLSQLSSIDVSSDANLIAALHIDTYPQISFYQLSNGSYSKINDVLVSDATLVRRMKISSDKSTVVLSYD